MQRPAPHSFTIPRQHASSERALPWIHALRTESGARVHDTYADQLAELLRTRAPSSPAIADEERIEAHLAGRPLEQQGTYVYYPWKNEVVRLLDEAEFVELRSNRNQLKIRAEQQLTLRRRRIAIAGLSVGMAVATTLALEGIGGSFHLADFDTLSLSNLNRIFGSVTELGLTKVEIAARRMLEIDPYFSIRIFPAGVDADSLQEFMTDVDLLVEETDDLRAKITLRHHARQAGIPTLMHTSEGGLLDVERFDRQPTRALLHGKLPTEDADTLAALDPAGRRDLVMRLVDEGLGGEALASMLEIGRTLTTWPQLGTAVVLGGAVVGDVARRVLLDEFHESGRYRIDPTRLIADGSGTALPERDATTGAWLERADAVTWCPLPTGSAARALGWPTEFVAGLLDTPASLREADVTDRPAPRFEAASADAIEAYALAEEMALLQGRFDALAIADAAPELAMPEGWFSAEDLGLLRLIHERGAHLSLAPGSMLRDAARRRYARAGYWCILPTRSLDRSAGRSLARLGHQLRQRGEQLWRLPSPDALLQALDAQRWQSHAQFATALDILRSLGRRSAVFASSIAT